MKSIIAAAAAIVALAAALAIATPSDAAAPRHFDAVAATSDATVAVEYIAFAPMQITARPADLVMEPLVIDLSAPSVATIEMEPMVITAASPAVETIEMPPMYIVATRPDFTRLAAF